MGRARRPEGRLPLAPSDDVPDHLLRPFYRAAMSSRFIGAAAMTVGAVTLLFVRRQLPRYPGVSPKPYVAAAAFCLTVGLLYVVLGGWVARRRRWAVRAAMALTMTDMTLLGLIFITVWPAALPCAVAGLFVVALGVLSAFLGRSLRALRQVGI